MKRKKEKGKETEKHEKQNLKMQKKCQQGPKGSLEKTSFWLKETVTPEDREKEKGMERKRDRNEGNEKKEKKGKRKRKEDGKERKGKLIRKKRRETEREKEKQFCYLKT